MTQLSESRKNYGRPIIERFKDSVDEAIGQLAKHRLLTNNQGARATGFSRLLCSRFCGRRDRASTKESTGRNSGSKVPHFPPQ